MTILLYRIAVGFYHLGIRLASFFNTKARSWVQGRSNWLAELQDWRSGLPTDAQVIWMHCASLGEFEQGRPVLEALRQDFPDSKIVLSFYSPSGYELRHNYATADYVCYLPPDSPANARHWLDHLQPSLIVFVKYEFWYYHLRTAFQRQIPTYLIAAVFRPGQLFFQWYGSSFKRLLSSFSHIFVQTTDDKELLTRHRIDQVTVAGDPRVDQVLTIAESKTEFPLIASFKNEHLLFIAGSTWPPGEDIILADQQLWAGDWKLLIAPHDISEGHIQSIIQQCILPWVRYSTSPDEASLKQARILILDTIGMLSRVYRYGELAYIGGGFGRSIHNILEPAAHGLPVMFGPRHEKFSEALALRERGGGFLVNNEETFQATFQHLINQEKARQARQEIMGYLQLSKGAASQIAVELGAVLRPE